MARQKTKGTFEEAKNKVEEKRIAARDRKKREELSLAMLFKSLGDPTRIAIVSLLRQASMPMTIGEICQYLTEGKSFTSTVAHHLKELKNARLILIEKIGKTKQCRLNPDAFIPMAHYIELQKTVRTKADLSVSQHDGFPNDLSAAMAGKSNRMENVIEAGFESYGCDYIAPV